MLVAVSEVVQSAKRDVATAVRRERSDKFHGGVSGSMKVLALDHSIQPFRAFAEREVDLPFASSVKAHQLARHYVQRRSQVVDHVSDDRSYLLVNARNMEIDQEDGEIGRYPRGPIRNPDLKPGRVCLQIGRNFCVGLGDMFPGASDFQFRRTENRSDYGGPLRIGDGIGHG